jgi:amidohydrolase
MSEVDTDDLIETRRHLHRHPELSNQEHATSTFIREWLRAAGIEQVESVSGTGVVAMIEGAASGPTIGWRADIDALPILEENDTPYASQNDGVMHACGHDVHTTIGLGIARDLHRRRDEMSGNVKMIFQPAEEATPEDEPVGAERMVVDGVLEDPPVDALFALHCMPKLEVGHIGHTGGPVWAGSTLIDIEVTGEKAHAAFPHEGIDAGLVASHIVTGLQSVVSRRIDARDAAVVTIGEITSGNAYNVLPETASLTGTLRTLDESVAESAKSHIRQLAEQIAQGFDATADVSFTSGARPVVNDAETERAMVNALRDQVGESVVDFPPQLAAEDFSSFSRRRPSCFVFLGIRNEQAGITSGLHTPTFDVDEACLKFAVDAFVPALLQIGNHQRW